MRRKVFTLLAVLLIATLLLAACGSGEEGPSGPSEPTGPEAPAVVEEEAEAEEPAEVEEPAEEEVVVEEPTPTFEPTATTIPAVEGDVPTGYYNLADFLEQTNKTFETYGEAPMLAERVASGDLPPVEERLPENPLVYRTMDIVGEYGGTMRHDSINIDQDWHLRHTNSANMIEMPASASWDAVSTVYGVPKQPGILESFGMNEDGTEFTGTIRKGLKWSDGTPVTTTDVAFNFNDVLLNEEIYPAPSTWLTWGGGNTELTIVDDYTFKYTFAAPYGSFIEAEVTLWPATFYKHLYPSHYLSQYHKDYADPDELLAMMQAEEYNTMDEWVQFFGDKRAMWGVDRSFELDNGKTIPTLNPFIAVEDQGNGNYLLERNPYFYMVDQEGNQLPYIEKLQRTYIADSEQADLSIIAGNTDMSCMSISIDSFPLYKEHEADGNYVALPLPAWQDQIYIVGFNEWAGVKPPLLESAGMEAPADPVDDSSYDPGLSEVYSDVRFRRAMSLALDRDTMNEALYLGLGRPAQVAPRPGTPFYVYGMD
jgi:peptide/nickel transport system substrate-binding protein